MNLKANLTYSLYSKSIFIDFKEIARTTMSILVEFIVKFAVQSLSILVRSGNFAVSRYGEILIEW